MRERVCFCLRACVCSLSFETIESLRFHLKSKSDRTTTTAAATATWEKIYANIFYLIKERLIYTLTCVRLLVCVWHKWLSHRSICILYVKTVDCIDEMSTIFDCHHYSRYAMLEYIISRKKMKTNFFAYFFIRFYSNISCVCVCNIQFIIVVIFFFIFFLTIIADFFFHICCHVNNIIHIRFFI